MSFRLGIIGAGIVAAHHVRAAARLPSAEVRAICDIRLDVATALATEAGAVAYADHRDMLARVPLDGVIITAPHALHAAMTLDAAAAGLHVLVEKPMATSVADCTAMIDACSAAGVVLAVGHVLRFDANARRAREVLRSGRLGAVRALDHRRTAHYRRGSRPAWFFDPVLAGGGIVMNVGTHGLDRIRWLTGATVDAVQARTWRRGGLEIETDAMCLLTLTGGVAAHVLLTSEARAYTDETVVLCEDGGLRWSATDGLWLSEDGRETMLAPPSDVTGDAFAAQLGDFVAACRLGRAPAVDGGYGRSVVAAVAAAYASADSGRPVRPAA